MIKKGGREMDWESYRTDIEAIKLAVNECEWLGVDKEELLIISIYRLYEFYKTEDDRVYLLGALLHLKAYLELGMEYEKNRKIFSLILDNYGVCYQEIFQEAEKMEWKNLKNSKNQVDKQRIKR